MRHLTALLALLLWHAATAHAVLGPGDTTGIAITVGSLARIYDVHVPASYDGSVPVPLVLDLHGYSSTQGMQASLSGMKAIADANGFIVAYPAGVGPVGQMSWNAGTCCDPAKADGVDDVAFMHAVVGDIVANANIDRRRVYATGLSNGAFMSHRLGCDAADLFAAIAPVAAPLGIDPVTDCQPVRPIPVLQFSGLTDQVVPYDGGPTSVFPDVIVIPALDSYAYWATVNGCSAGGAFLDLGNGASLRTHTGCTDGVEVQLYSINGNLFLGHILYGNADGIDVAQRIWDFFSRFTLPGDLPTTTTSTTSTTSTTLPPVIDHPVDGRKLGARRANSGKETLTFTAKTPALPFPTLGGPDDPRTAGATLEILSPAEGTATLALPAGAWSSNKAGTRLKFANKTAPNATSAVKVVTLVRGKALSLTAKALGLPFAVSEGHVAVRLTMGLQRTCARFGGTITRDLPGKFAAKNAPAAGLADCADATLVGP